MFNFSKIKSILEVSKMFLRLFILFLPILTIIVFALVHFGANILFQDIPFSEVIRYTLSITLIFSILFYFYALYGSNSKEVKYFYNRWLGNYFTYRLLMFIYVACIFTYLLLQSAAPQSTVPNNRTTTIVTEQTSSSNAQTSKTTTEQNSSSDTKTPTTIDQKPSLDYRTLGTIAAAFAGVIIYLVKTEENNRRNALKYTTDNRSDWMKYGRECTAQLIKNNEKFLILIDQKHLYKTINTNSASSGSGNNPDSGKILDVYQKFMSELICSLADIRENIAALKLHYNFVGGRDNVLLKLLDMHQETIIEFEPSVSNQTLNDRKLRDKIRYILNELLWHTQIYNKVEWERLKEEVSYVGNIDVRDQYIKLKMIDKREKYYFAQILQNWNMIKKDYRNYDKNLLDLSIITTYCKLIKPKTPSDVKERLDDEKQNNLYKELKSLYKVEIKQFLKYLKVIKESDFNRYISSNPKFYSSDALRNQLQEKIQNKIVPDNLDTWPEFDTQDNQNN